MLLPFDVANRAGIVGCGTWNSSCGGWDFLVFWQVIMFIVLFFISLIVPFFVIYYESDESDIHENSQVGRYGSATCYSVIFTVIIFVVILICFFIFGKIYLTTNLTTVAVTGFEDMAQFSELGDCKIIN